MKIIARKLPAPYQCLTDLISGVSRDPSIDPPSGEVPKEQELAAKGLAMLQNRYSEAAKEFQVRNGHKPKVLVFRSMITKTLSKEGISQEAEASRQQQLSEQAALNKPLPDLSKTQGLNKGENNRHKGRGLGE